jgi:hypothetical protein
MGTATGQSVGIDVGEQHPDVHLHPAGLGRRLPYTADVIDSLRTRRESEFARPSYPLRRAGDSRHRCLGTR